MKHPLRFLYILGFLFAVIPLSAQDTSEINSGRGESNRHRRTSLQININARVIDEDMSVVWNQAENKTTILGRAVTYNLVASNVIVAFQFTPLLRRGNRVLVAQGQIWIFDPASGVTGYTSFQTIPMEFNEPIYFYPLGRSAQPDLTIEIVITVSQQEALNEN